MAPRMKAVLVLQASVVAAALAAIVVIVIRLTRGDHSTGGLIFAAIGCVVLVSAALTRIIQLIKLAKKGRGDKL